MLNNRLTATQILQSIGGATNLDTYSCCSTRLKIKVRKEELVNEAALDDIPAVKGFFKYIGAYYLILGVKNVNGVYEALHRLINFERHPRYDMSVIELDDNTNVVRVNNNCFVCPKCGYKTTKGYLCPICGTTVISTSGKETEPVIINNNYYNPAIHIHIENSSINGLTFNQIMQYNGCNQQAVSSVTDNITIFTNFITYITKRDQMNDAMARDVIVILKDYSDMDVRMLGTSMQQEVQVGRNPLAKLRRWILQHKDDVDASKKFFDALSSATRFARKWGPWLAKALGL